MATTMQILTAIARGKAEILADVGVAVSSRGDTMPLYPTSFSELHDYVDANTYAGLCDDDDLSAALLPHANEIQSALSGWLLDRANRREEGGYFVAIDGLPDDDTGDTILVAVTLRLRPSDLLVDGDQPEPLGEVVESILARVADEAGYLSDGYPIMPREATVAILGGTDAPITATYTREDDAR